MNNKIYYGRGSCSLNADDVVGLSLKYTGRLYIMDKTSNNYYIIANNKKILIFPFGKVEPLTDLFEYRGEFRILSARGSNSNGDKVAITLKGGFDYSESLNTNAEDITTNSESLNSTYLHRGAVGRTIVDNKIIKDQHSTGELYLKTGESYSGAYHIHLHLNTAKAMTGSEHTKASENLYRTINGKDVAVAEPRRRTAMPRTGGYGGGSMGGGSGGGGGGY